MVKHAEIVCRQEVRQFLAVPFSRYCSNITECGFSASAVWNLLPVTQLESSALIIMALI